MHTNNKTTRRGLLSAALALIPSALLSAATESASVERSLPAVPGCWINPDDPRFFEERFVDEYADIFPNLSPGVHRATSWRWFTDQEEKDLRPYEAQTGDNLFAVVGGRVYFCSCFDGWFESAEVRARYADCRVVILNEGGVLLAAEALCEMGDEVEV